MSKNNHSSELHIISFLQRKFKCAWLTASWIRNLRRLDWLISGFPGAATCAYAPFELNSIPSDSSQLLCPINKTWPEILDLEEKQLAWVGGLGQLATAEARVWMCLNTTFPDISCPASPDLACYVYLIFSMSFMYYGPNSYLNLVQRPRQR